MLCISFVILQLNKHKTCQLEHLERKQETDRFGKEG